MLYRRAQLLAGATVAYNTIEALVAVVAGRAVDSAALVGFGLDSVLEVSSGLIVLWQFRHEVPESRERAALRLMSVAFFGLAAYVGIGAARTLASGTQPSPSAVGIALAMLSLLLMPVLSAAQRRTGRQLGSGSVVADSKQTLLCTYLSVVLLAGLITNAILGWWWADPIAGTVIAGVAFQEGLRTWRGEGCCAAPKGVGAVVATPVDECCASVESIHSVVEPKAHRADRADQCRPGPPRSVGAKLWAPMRYSKERSGEGPRWVQR